MCRNSRRITPTNEVGEVTETTVKRDEHGRISPQENTDRLIDVAGIEDVSETVRQRIQESKEDPQMSIEELVLSLDFCETSVPPTRETENIRNRLAI